MPFADSKKLDEQLRKAKRDAEERDAERKARTLGLPYIDLRPAPVQPEALALVPEEIARKNFFATTTLHNKNVVVATSDPANAALAVELDRLRAAGYHPILNLCSPGSLAIAWESYQYVVKKEVRITGQVSIHPEELERIKEQISSIADAATVIAEFDRTNTSRMLETVLAGALAVRASDIHIEPAETAARTRFRIDGELNDIAAIDTKTYHALVSRMKLLAGLKLNVHDEPQDGRFTTHTKDKDIEIRASTIPSEYGEAIVLRVLDPDAINVQLSDLGFRKEDMEVISLMLKKPNGMILNTGPTGSGKTTTLYAFIKHLYDPTIKVITIEDPIEYHVTGISQTQVDPAANYTFVSGLRSILRQDPDVILVGEIRDLDTAEIAMHAALTGHVVFSTLHTNDASGALPRLIDMGAKTPIIGPALNLIIAQRLVRKVCPACKIPRPLTEEDRKNARRFLETLPPRIGPLPLDRITLYAASDAGCEKCHHGYRGRIGVFELFIMTDEIEKLLHDKEGGPTSAEVKNAAIKNGMATMQQDGILKAYEGITTLEEVERATGSLSFDVPA